jgi:hypothetical protein
MGYCVQFRRGLSNGKHVFNMFSPTLHSIAFFIRKAVSLVHAGDACKASRYMIQKLFHHGQADTEPRHAARDCAADIVQNPWRGVRRHERIEAPLD